MKTYAILATLAAFGFYKISRRNIVLLERFLAEGGVEAQYEEWFEKEFPMPASGFRIVFNTKKRKV